MSEPLTLTVTPTDCFETIDGVPSRVWAGTTADGIPVKAWIRCVQPQTDRADLLEAFDAHLLGLESAPSAIDLRFVL